MSVTRHPLAWMIAGLARGLSGVQVQWQGCAPSERQRVYFANHTSHLDFVVLWSALPAKVRGKTRPVAAKDYWDKGLRSYLAQTIFRAVLIERRFTTRENQEQPRTSALAVIQQLADALGESNSLIFFPEGTRGSGETVAEFKGGLYHLAKRRPDVEFVPVYLENLNRILPKGEILPVPLLSLLTFGPPIQVNTEEGKAEFLQRARDAVCSLRRQGSQ